ncbi:hypothetical protein [Streptomyces griseoaurantiacus]|uniref:hypothetical protein n=1 Tax=Streptomyces griseoaurantiacus TaxID=68213 RepID=UPI000592F13C|nr:hypothetical protein [Streptomyces griseoaurantiacus]
MAGRGQLRRRGLARLLALCAVLLGLFLMHGAPATAAEGCHGAMSTPAGMHEAPAPGAMISHHLAAVQSAAGQVTAHPGTQHASGAAAMDGTTCVSTPARDTTPLTAPALLAVAGVLAALFMVGRTLAPGRTGRRGPPPPGGRSLLLQVCIART